MSDFRDTDVKKPGWEIHIFDILIGPSFINKYTVSVSIYERLARVTSKLAQNEYTGSASHARQITFQNKKLSMLWDSAK